MLKEIVNDLHGAGGPSVPGEGKQREHEKPRAAQAYAVTSIPRTYFINGEGKIVTYKIGLITESQLQNAIKLLLP